MEKTQNPTALLIKVFLGYLAYTGVPFPDKEQVEKNSKLLGYLSQAVELALENNVAHSYLSSIIQNN